MVYYDYRSTELQDLPVVLSAILKQLCQNRKDVPEGFLEAKRNSHPPSYLGNTECVRKLAQNFEEVFLVVDALDECLEEKRCQVIGFLQAFLETTSARIKIFVTSRREGDIVESFEDGRIPIIQIKAENVAGDILTYVSRETQRLRQGYGGKRLYVKDDALEEKIIETLTEKADGMYV